MIRALLGLDETQDIAGIGWSLRGGWVLAVVLIALAIAFSIYLYRSEKRVSTRRRVIMTGCQIMVLLLLILIILQPVADVRLTKTFKRTMLVLLDTSRSMGIEDARTTPDQIADAAVALGKIKPGETLDATRAQTLSAEIGPAKRIDLARAALQNSAIDLHGKLSKNYNVRFFSFDDELKPKPGDDDTPWAGQVLGADGESSQVGSAMEEAVARFAGQPVAGVVVLSDFNWVEGKDPSAVARRLKTRGIPAYPAAVGLPAPPDVHVRGVIAPDYVFKGDRVPLRIKIESHGYKGETVELNLMIDGEESASQQVVLRDGIQHEEMMFIPQKESGSIELELVATPLQEETSEKNNSATHKVQILDEKIKVLYVEGMPRWEYRYLRWVLLRDPRLDVKFLMTQGDPDLPKTSPRHVGRFPEEAKKINEYDLIIIGDVSASYFSNAQMSAIEEQIKTDGRGGSLLMIAGPTAAPSTYRDTLIAKILPVELGNGGLDNVAGDISPIVTAAGRESLVTSLSLSDETSNRIWSKVKPMHQLPNLGGAKPGATVLLSLPKASDNDPDYPVVAWQRYGAGKSMFVATEDLWRMRLEVGDRYHARFWGQAIQFLTLSRLLGQNKQITLETDRTSYSGGEQIRVFANLLTESLEPQIQDSYEVVVEQAGVPDSSTVLELKPVPDSEGLYSGTMIAEDDGGYLVRTQALDEKISNKAEFSVATEPVEDRETAMKADVARQIAELSGGKVLNLSNLSSLPDQLGKEPVLSNIVRIQRELWDAPLLYLLIVLFAGTEWYLRRKENLV